ncbi:hypothetical protein CBL_11788 [Carabus blaptoides fortunei]
MTTSTGGEYGTLLLLHYFAESCYRLSLFVWSQCHVAMYPGVWHAEFLELAILCRTITSLVVGISEEGGAPCRMSCVLCPGSSPTVVPPTAVLPLPLLYLVLPAAAASVTVFVIASSTLRGVVPHLRGVLKVTAILSLGHGAREGEHAPPLVNATTRQDFPHRVRREMGADPCPQAEAGPTPPAEWCGGPRRHQVFVHVCCP